MMDSSSAKEMIFDSAPKLFYSVESTLLTLNAIQPLKMYLMLGGKELYKNKVWIVLLRYARQAFDSSRKRIGDNALSPFLYLCTYTNVSANDHSFP